MITDFCVICGTKDNLHNHHIVCKKSELKPISGDYDHYTNLLTLCGEHHGWIHGVKPNRFNNWSELKKLGIESAKRRLVKFGAPRKIDDKKVHDLWLSGRSAIEIAEELGVARASVYRYLSLFKKQGF